MVPIYNGTKYIHILKTRARDRARKDQSKSKPKPRNTDDKHSSSISGVWSLDGIVWASEGLRATPIQQTRSKHCLLLARIYSSAAAFLGRCPVAAISSSLRSPSHMGFTQLHKSVVQSLLQRFLSFHTFLSLSNFLAPWCKIP